MSKLGCNLLTVKMHLHLTVLAGVPGLRAEWMRDMWRCPSGTRQIQAISAKRCPLWRLGPKIDMLPVARCSVPLRHGVGGLASLLKVQEGSVPIQSTPPVGCASAAAAAIDEIYFSDVFTIGTLLLNTFSKGSFRKKQGWPQR